VGLPGLPWLIRAADKSQMTRKRRALTATAHKWLHAICGFLFLVSLSFSLSANSQDVTHPWLTVEDKKIMGAFIKSGEKGVLAVFKGDPSLRLSPLEMSYKISKIGTLQAIYLLGNYTDKPLKYIVICLIDYQQQVITLNNQDSKTHEISLLPGEQKIFSLAITAIKQGSHDFVLLAIRKEEKADFQVLTHRANLFVNDGEFPSIEYSKVKTAFANPLPSAEIVFRQTEKPETALSSESNLDQAEEYSLHITNRHNLTTRYAVIFFTDFRQMSLGSSNSSNDGFENVYFISLRDQTTGIIPGRIPKNNKKIFAIALENPYQFMEPALGMMTRNPASTFVSNVITNNLHGDDKP
jgi:hypothetical protein